MVVTLVGEDVGEPLAVLLARCLCSRGPRVTYSWNKSGTETDGHRGSEDETVAAGEWYRRDNTNTGHSDGREEESGHSTENCGWNRHKRRGELGKDSHDEKPEAAGITCSSVGTTSEGNNTVVLGESGHWGNGAETGNYTVQSIS
jgi:hypothetical protein